MSAENPRIYCPATPSYGVKSEIGTQIVRLSGLFNSSTLSSQFDDGKPNTPIQNTAAPPKIPGMKLVLTQHHKGRHLHLQTDLI